MKIFRKFCECLKINAKSGEGCAIFGTPNLWNFYVKYYKSFIQKLEEKSKKILPYRIRHMLPWCYQFYIINFWCWFRILPHVAHLLPESTNRKEHNEYCILSGFIFTVIIFAANTDKKPLIWFTFASIRQENVKKM